MKRFILSCLCCTISFALYAQDWKHYKIDDSVQVSLPPDFTQTDTLGQIQITAKTSYGYIQIAKQRDNSNTTPDIEKEKHLKRYYNNFIDRIKLSAKGGIVTNEKDTIIGKLRVRDFTLAIDSGSGKQLRNFRILHENNATYTFQYLHQDIHQEYAAPEREAFFSSITVPPSIGRKSQYTSPENTTGISPPSNTILYIVEGTVVALIFLGMILYQNKKRRR